MMYFSSVLRLSQPDTKAGGTLVETEGASRSAYPRLQGRGRGRAASRRVSYLSYPKIVLTVSSIVVVHGLNGHRDKTWTAANGTHWLRDLLPTDIPNARVFCWGYDANTHGEHVSCQYLYDHAMTLVSELCLERRLTKVCTKAVVEHDPDYSRHCNDQLSLWHTV
jgi:hypothetical protein